VFQIQKPKPCFSVQDVYEIIFTQTSIWWQQWSLGWVVITRRIFFTFA